MTKPDVCRQRGVDLMIEDHLDHARACANAGTRALLVDQPWNQGETPSGVQRVYNWQEGLVAIRSISETLSQNP